MRDAAIDPLRQPGRGAARARTSGAPSLDGLLGEGPAARGGKPAARQDGATSAAIAARRLGGGRTLPGGRRRDEPGLVARLRARMPRIRPFKALTVTAFTIALVGIVANAMVFQRGRHPAPLFGLGQPAEDVPGAAPRIAPAPPPTAPAAVEPTGTVAAAAAAPAPAAVPAPPAVAAAPKPVHHAAPKPHREDGIGGLLAAAGPSPAVHARPGHAAPPASAGSHPTDTHPMATAATAAKAKPAVKPGAKAEANGAATAHHLKAAEAHPRPHAAAPAAKATEASSAPPAKAAAQDD